MIAVTLLGISGGFYIVPTLCNDASLLAHAHIVRESLPANNILNAVFHGIFCYIFNYHSEYY